MKLRIALALFLLVAAATACSAQEITVRVANGKTGKPLKDESVFVQFLDQTSSSKLSFITDAKGEAHFAIPTPYPEHLNVRVVLNSEHWRCGCLVMADTKTVVQQGIVERVPKKNAKGSDMVAGKPKEIVIVARPLTFGERLLYPLVKD